MTPPWRYRLLVRLLSPLLLGYTAWRACKDGGWRYWWQRLGVYRYEPETGNPADNGDSLWIHAASVGEIITVLPLIKLWKLRSPAASILVTTGTPTGAAVLDKHAVAGVHHQYLPVDFAGASQRFVKQLQARRGWIVETEIWPWLYARCAQQGIELTIVNGRLSSRTSTQAEGLLGSSYHRALAGVNVLARSQVDADNFIRLGAPADHVRFVGNLKYAYAGNVASETRPIQRSYVLAASTHDDEEMQLARAWVATGSEHLLVIVPRHPERGGGLLRAMSALDAGVALRSTGHSPGANDRLYLADTLGEMQAWYQHATAAFVGGSLIPRGGHNMLEPARHGCPTVVGPHTSNFDDIMQLLTEAGAIEVAQSADDVVRFLRMAASTSPDYAAMGQRARSLAESSGKVLQHYLQALD